jgi:hypothetical protein
VVQSSFKNLQTLEERAHHATHTQRRLMPIDSRNVESLRKRGGIKGLTHGAVSSYRVSASVAQNGF